MKPTNPYKSNNRPLDARCTGLQGLSLIQAGFHCLHIRVSPSNGISIIAPAYALVTVWLTITWIRGTNSGSELVESGDCLLFFP